MIKYSTRDGKVLAILRIGDKVYMGVGITQDQAYAELIKHINVNKFAAFDFSLPTTAHNSSGRTRV